MYKKIIDIKKNQILASIIILLFISLPLIFSLNIFNSFFIEIMEKLIGRNLRDYQKWSRIIKNLIHIPFLIFSVIFFVNYFVIGKVIHAEFKTKIKKLLEYIKIKKNLYIILFTFVFLFTSFYLIIHANYYYQDDLFRNYSGDRGWISFGRFISEFLSPIIHTTIDLTDITPLTQFISLTIMSLSLFILCYSLSNKDVNFIGIILLSFIFISPFYAQCFNYRFDNPYMTMAVFFIVIPFLFLDDNKTFIFVSIICLILSCMSYQSSTSIYIMIVVFKVLDNFINKADKKEIFRIIIISVISFIAGLLIYNILFMSKPNPIYGEPVNDYYFDTTISFGAIIPNLLNYFKILSSSFGTWQKIFILISIFLFIFLNIKKSLYNKLFSTVIVITLLLFALILSLGPYLAFSRTLLLPRVYMGFNSYVALILFYTYKTFKNSTNKKAKLLYIPLVCVIYGSITFLYTYGNCLIQQDKYTNFRINNLLSDLSEFTTTTRPNVELRGNIGYCKTISLARKKYPVINQLLVPMPGNNGFWDQDIFYFYNFVIEKSTISEELPLVKSTYYHNIYGNGESFIIELKENDECL